MRTHITQQAFYQYRLHTYDHSFNVLSHGGSLFQQYIIDTWAICNGNKLDWLCKHQANFYADLYNSLTDAMIRTDIDVASLNHRVILSSSHTGSDQFMMQLFQDSMAIVYHFS